MNPDLFRQAAQVIRNQGHNKGTYTSPTGEVCAVGALSTAATGNPVPIEGWADMPEDLGDALVALSRAVPSNIIDEDPIERIADWNDRQATTPADVIAQLEAAANAIETAIAETDRIAHVAFGRDETRWTTGQQRDYVEAIITARTDQKWAA